MKKTLLVSLAAIAAAIVSLAPAAITPALAADTAWTASYWNNVKMNGNPVLSRTEAAVTYNWKLGSPLAGTVRNDRFSARWTRTAGFEGGTYIFRVASDDGVRVWVDDQKIVDQWNDHSLQTATVVLDLPAGDHAVKVEYYENGGDASISVGWALATADAWTAEYHNGKNLRGRVIVTRPENVIKNFWNATSPAPGVKANNFSARWTRTMNTAAGKYRFKVTVSGGFRLYVDNKLVLDEWYNHGGTASAINLKLSAGDHDIRLDYYNHSDPAVLILGISTVK